jgi:hypothetical protein
MDDLFLLSEAQMRRIKPYFPLSHGIVRVDALKPGAKAYSRADGLVPGLSLGVEPTGSKSWHLRFRFKGKQVNLGLGRYPVVGLALAHERAQIALGQVAQGRNPAEAALDTVEAIAESYIVRYARPNFSTEWGAMSNACCAAISSRHGLRGGLRKSPGPTCAKCSIRSWTGCADRRQSDVGSL